MSELSEQVFPTEVFCFDTHENAYGWATTFPVFNVVHSSRPYSAQKKAVALHHECDLKAPPKSMKQLSAQRHFLKSKHVSPNHEVKSCGNPECSTRATHVHDCAFAEKVGANLKSGTGECSGKAAASTCPMQQASTHGSCSASSKNCAAKKI
eukprot:GDKJ01020210.1.p1 GENE.GDKJ01020210.1~~GDKJ01020210.1.p1  ORF type:complete len:152 (-),score=34.55 GDKJ01020210.1:90-545(-)